MSKSRSTKRTADVGIGYLKGTAAHQTNKCLLSPLVILVIIRDTAGYINDETASLQAGILAVAKLLIGFLVFYRIHYQLGE